MLALLTRPSTAERFVLRAEDRACDLAALWAHSPQQLYALRRAYLGFVHQAGGLYPFLTVQDNIGLPLRLTGQTSQAETARRVDALLEFLGLRHVARSLPENPFVRRTPAHRRGGPWPTGPRLILADEPTSALDPEAARTTMSLLLQGKRMSGAALLWSATTTPCSPPRASPRAPCGNSPLPRPRLYPPPNPKNPLQP